MDSTPADTPGVARFHSCRWRKPTEDGVPEHCTHRDVLPMAGKDTFNADAWCTDCAFYKAKRVTRKREEPVPPQDDDWRFRY